MLEQKFRQWEQEYIQQGKEDGFPLGKQEGLNESMASQKRNLLEMLADRFGQIPASWEESINQIGDRGIINRLTKAVYKTQSSEEYGKILEVIHSIDFSATGPA